MDLDFFEIEINGRIQPVAKHEFSPYEKSFGKKGFRITVWDSNIAAAKHVILEHHVKHITVSTSSLNFLNDPEFKNLLGVYINGEISDLKPLEKLNSLEYLELLNGKKGRVDLRHFPKLKQFSCEFTSKYKNIDSLINLENLYLVKYSKSNLEQFKNLHELIELHLLSAKCESLNGLQSLTNLRKITIEDCKRLTSLDGLVNNGSLSEILINDCRNIADFSAMSKLNKDSPVFINGEPFRSDRDTTIDPILNLVSSLNEIDTEKELIEEVQNSLANLKASINSNNWKIELKKCIIHLNQINSKLEGIYSGEREEIIRTIQYLLTDYDFEKVEMIIDENRQW